MIDDPDEETERGTRAGAEAREGLRAEPLLTEEEVAFLLAPPDGELETSDAAERRGERNARGNRTRTERRRHDPAFAQRLRDADRERQRRRRARVAVADARPSTPTGWVPNLPDLSPDMALRRLEAHALGNSGARATPDLLRRYVTAFLVYRALAADGGRPTLGAIAGLMEERHGVAITRAQAQRLRRHVEAFLAPGGPWCDGKRDR